MHSCQCYIEHGFLWYVEFMGRVWGYSTVEQLTGTGYTTTLKRGTRW